VSYYFKTKPGGPVKLDFLDSSGALVKTISQAPAEEGMNRFEWDLRYPDAHGIEGETHLAGGSLRGPMAVPGNYRVRLASNLGTAEQSFKILKDPRLPTTDEDYQKQLRFLLEIRDAESEVNDAINHIRDTLARRKSSGGANDAVHEQLEEILHELWEPRFTGYDDQMLVFPLKLNNRIAALQGYADGGFAPTDQDVKVFNALSAELEGLLSRLKHLPSSGSTP
jgi:hypothetical protein